MSTTGPHTVRNSTRVIALARNTRRVLTNTQLRINGKRPAPANNCVLHLPFRARAFAELWAIAHTERRSPHPVTHSMLRFCNSERRVALVGFRRLNFSGAAVIVLCWVCGGFGPRAAMAAEAPPVAELGGFGAALQADTARKRLFVSLPDSEQLAVIDGKRLSVTARVLLPGQPRGLALRAASGELLVALSSGRGFAVIEPSSLAVTRYEFLLPAEVRGFDQVADMGRGRVLLYSAAAPGRFAVFDSAAPHTLLWSAATLMHEAQSLEFDRERQQLYTTRAGRFVVLDFATPDAPVVVVDSAQLSDGSPLAGRALAQLRFDARSQRVVSGDGLVFDAATQVPWSDLKSGLQSVLSVDGRFSFSSADDGRIQRRGLRDAADNRALSLSCAASEVTSLAVLADDASVVALAGAQVCGTVGSAQRVASLAATVAATVPSPLELYPSHRDAKWIYRKLSDSSVETSTIVGAATVEKRAVWKTLFADQTYNFRHVSAKEASEVRAVFPVDLQTVTSVPPNLLVKSTDQISKSYVQNGYYSAVQGTGKPRKVNYRQTRKIVGYTNVKLSFGTFRALRIDYNIVQTFQNETRSSNGTSWLVPGLGEVQLGAKGKPSTVLRDATVDLDKDGINAKTDNCRVTKNANQLDTDSDKSGDVCDKDDDGDGVADTVDNCPLVKNPAQTNSDADPKGDACQTPLP